MKTTLGPVDMAFQGNYFYVAHSSAPIRYNYTSGAPAKLADLPGGG